MTRIGEATAGQLAMEGYPERASAGPARERAPGQLRGGLALLFLVVATPSAYGLMFLAFRAVFGGS